MVGRSASGVAGGSRRADRGNDERWLPSEEKRPVSSSWVSPARPRILARSRAREGRLE